MRQAGLLTPMRAARLTAYLPYLKLSNVLLLGISLCSVLMLALDRHLLCRFIIKNFFISLECQFYLQELFNDFYQQDFGLGVIVCIALWAFQFQGLSRGSSLKQQFWQQALFTRQNSEQRPCINKLWETQPTMKDAHLLIEKSVLALCVRHYSCSLSLGDVNSVH